MRNDKIKIKHAISGWDLPIADRSSFALIFDCWSLIFDLLTHRRQDSVHLIARIEANADESGERFLTTEDELLWILISDGLAIHHSSQFARLLVHEMNIFRQTIPNIVPKSPLPSPTFIFSCGPIAWCHYERINSQWPTAAEGNVEPSAWLDRVHWRGGWLERTALRIH